MDKENRTHIEEVDRNRILDAQKQNSTVGYTDEDIIVMDDLKTLSITRPIKMNMNTILICTEGRMQADLNGSTYSIERRDVLICSPHIIMNNTLISPDFTCKILMLTDKIVQGFLRNKSRLWNEAFYVNRRYILHLDEYQFDIFRYYYELIHKRIKEPSAYFQKDIMQSILQATLFEVCGALSRAAEPEGPSNATQGEQLFKRFMELLSGSDVKRHPIFHYAKQLCVTPKYLSTICKSLSGKTASKWIQEYTDEDIRYFLRDTNMSIKEVANTLAFPNLSFFGKYVRTHFGMSPGEFRRRSRHKD